MESSNLPSTSTSTTTASTTPGRKSNSALLMVLGLLLGIMLGALLMFAAIKYEVIDPGTANEETGDTDDDDEDENDDDDASEGFKTYSGGPNTYSFEYPEDWTISGSPNEKFQGEDDLSLTLHDGDKTAGMTLLEYAEEAYFDEKDLVYTENEEITINGDIEAHLITADFPDGTPELWVIVSRGDDYMLFAMEFKNYTEADRDLIEQIYNSIEIAEI